MPYYRKSLFILTASLILPPAGLVLLWLKRDTSIPRKVAASLLIAAVAFAHLLLFYGMRVELLGDMRPTFTFRNVQQRDLAIERSRAAQAEAQPAAPPATAPAPLPTAPDTAPAAPPVSAGTSYWSDFRGPDRLGQYGQRPIRTAWPAEGLPRVWKQPVGGGYASFSVAGGLAFTIEQRRNREVVAAYQLSTGHEGWTAGWPAFFQETLGGDGPRSTPVWDEGRLYVLGAQGELRCLEAATGKSIWNKNILADNGAQNIAWGMAASPLIVDGKVIVLPGGSGGRSVVAYDKLTGARAWSALDDKAAYVSPIVATVAGRRQILVITAGRAAGLTVDSGNLLWEYPWVTQQGINCVEPLVVGPSRVFLSSGYGHGAAVLELTPQGDGFAVRTVWSNNRMKNKFNGPVLFEGHIYGLDEGILACIEAESGALKWKGGRYGYGQLLLASGHLVVLTEEGEVVLVRAAPDAHQQLARFTALSGKTWNYPAISDGLLLVRNASEMAAFRLGI
jgi:outer membrane protein assembly factor BamB